jgi:hypothetical protein
MPEPPVTPEVHQPLDTHRDVSAEITLHLMVPIDNLTNPHDLGVGQLVDPLFPGNTPLRADLLRRASTDAVNVRERDLDSFLSRNVYASNARQKRLSLSACSETEMKIAKRPGAGL